MSNTQPPEIITTNQGDSSFSTPPNPPDNPDDIDFNSTNEENDYLDKYSNSNSNSNESPNLDTDPVGQAYADIAKEDHAALNKMLLEKLSPQLEYNEGQKRGFKKRIMEYIIKVLNVQLGFFILIVTAFAFAFCFKFDFLKNITLDQLKYITTFLEFYVTSIIAEFIAMLFFIVKFVFDKSIVDLIMELFKKK